MALTALLLATASAAVFAAPPLDPNAPRNIVIVPNEDPSGLLISWTTGTPDWAHTFGSGARTPTAVAAVPGVRYGIAPGVYTSSLNGTSMEYNKTGDIIHRVNITGGLAISTRYYYVVGDAATSSWSTEWSFKSSPGVGSNIRTKFIIAADMGNNRKTAGAVQQQLAGLVAANDTAGYDLWLFPGDLSYAGSDAPGNISKQTQLWDAWMMDLQPIIARMPIITTVGNHDVNVSTGDTSGGECGVAVAHRFHMPFQDESLTDDSCAASYNVRYWYSLIRGSVWVHAFSTAHSYFVGSEQRAWIEQDLAAAAAAKAEGRVGEEEGGGGV